MRIDAYRQLKNQNSVISHPRLLSTLKPGIRVVDAISTEMLKHGISSMQSPCF